MFRPEGGKVQPKSVIGSKLWRLECHPRPFLGVQKKNYRQQAKSEHAALRLSGNTVKYFCFRLMFAILVLYLFCTVAPNVVHTERQQRLLCWTVKGRKSHAQGRIAEKAFS